MKPGDRLGHYTIVSHLGSGGMGAVYRATDSTLGRDVALKVLPPEMAGDPERLERFRREARAVAALNHPNIVTIFSVEQDAGVHYLTMELVSGRPLDRVLAESRLPIERVIDVAVALAGALAAAHDRGIVHRDLKPGNVITNDSGQVKVLDFGLAKVQSPTMSTPDAATATNLATSAGVVMGTPAYMSPEQVSGLGVDHRTDIFSLGVLLYEMATGTRPFQGRSSLELASSILRDAPRPAAELRSLPATLSSVISRCLEKTPSARFSSMAEVQRALQSASEPARAVADHGPSIAVLPFQNLSADPQNEFFGDGLAEEILNALTAIDGLRVAARTSSFSFKGAADLAEVGTRLRVATVLNGSVRRAGNRVRVTVELVNVADGFRIWSERYDREMSDIFDVQDQIAKAIADKLKVTLTAAESARLVKAPTANVEAYELFVRGRALLLKRGKHVEEGAACLHKAVELDPKFAAAWAGLADTFTVRGYWGSVPPGETMPKALTAARRAVALDPGLADGHSALAMTLLLWERDYAGAEAAFLRALELNPNSVQARAWYGLFLLNWTHGKIADGIEQSRLALQSDPLSSYTHAIHAMNLGGGGRTAEALDHARQSVAMTPDSLLSQWAHSLCAHWHAEFDEAVDAARRAGEVSGGHAFPVTHLACTLADAGRMSDAQREYDKANALAASRYVPKSSLALAASAIGQMDLAIDLVEEACDERDPVLLILSGSFPDGRRLYQDPRFANVRRRLGLTTLRP